MKTLSGVRPFFIGLLVAGVLFASCQNSSISGPEDEDTMSAIATSSSNSDLMAKSMTDSSIVYFSDESVLSYDVISVPTDVNWSTTVCNPDGSIGLDDPRWYTSKGQTAYNIRPLFSSGLHPFEEWWDGIYSPENFGEAEWINAVYEDQSTVINPDGDGHNWTRYEIAVEGNGDFEIKLLADNCSWVYLDDQIIGYQDDAGLGDSNTPISYGVTLDGASALTFIIFDGGGVAGGKFRLETTTDDIPPYNPGDNTAPVADAGADQTIEATGATTAVMLDGSASSDADGDALTYSWSNGSTDVSPSVELGVGSHTFTLTVSDGTDESSDDVTITVSDTTAPVISYEVEETNLWPANNRLKLVLSNVQAEDLVDGIVAVDFDIQSSEEISGRKRKGRCIRDFDYKIIENPDGTYNVRLRAERDRRSNNRTYTVTMIATDSSGNTTTEVFEATVSREQSNRGNGGKKKSGIHTRN